MKDTKDIARTFLSIGLQHWGQSKGDRLKAAQAVIDAARFDATVTGYPFKEGSWAGEDATEAQLWLQGMCKTMPWGKFEREVEHIEAAIEKRQNETVA